MELTKEIFELIFPQGTFEYFELTKGRRDESERIVYLTLEEKDIPPIQPDQKILTRKFHDITITDFPLRGRKTLLTVRRRYWKVEGIDQYVKRDIKFTFPGTQLEKEFADFLKSNGLKESQLL